MFASDVTLDWAFESDTATLAELEEAHRYNSAILAQLSEMPKLMRDNHLADGEPGDVFSRMLERHERHAKILEIRRAAQRSLENV